LAIKNNKLRRKIMEKPIKEEVRINQDSSIGTYNSPRLNYETIFFGQANYLLKRCKEEKIQAAYRNKRVYIYSKRKLPKFVELINESLEYGNKQAPTFNSETAVFSTGKKILCILKKENETIYSTNENMPDVVYHIFKKDIPKFSNFKLFSTLKEMKEHLLEVERVMI
jgi:hypothetical protein